jgi:hypothetical protein
MLASPSSSSARRSELPGNEVDLLIDTCQHLQALAVPVAVRGGRLISVESFEDQPEGGQTLTEAIVQVSGESTPLILLGDDEPAEQSRPGCFGLRAVGDLCREERLDSESCRRVSAGVGSSGSRSTARKSGAAVRVAAGGPPPIPDHTLVRPGPPEWSSGRFGSSVLMAQPPRDRHGALPLRFLQIIRANPGVERARPEHGGDVNTQCVLALPAEELLGTDVPGCDEPL